VKIFSNEQEMRTKRAQNAANGGLDSPTLIWRPGSAQARWGSLQLDSEGRGGMEGRDRDGEGRDRPAHFLVASAAYGYATVNDHAEFWTIITLCE